MEDVFLAYKQPPCSLVALSLRGFSSCLHVGRVGRTSLKDINLVRSEPLLCALI